MFSKAFQTFFRGVRSQSSKAPCGRSCDTCGQSMTCLKGRGFWRPMPWVFWIGMGAFGSVPIYANTHPFEWVMMTEKENIICEADKELKERIRGVFRNVGVRYPENVDMLITKDGDLKVIGTNTQMGAVVLIPEDLASMADPQNPLHITHFVTRQTPDGNEEVVEETIYDGPACNMPVETKKHLLDEYAYLVPEQSEIDYLFGHEGSHLAFNHAFTSVVYTVGCLTAAHGIAKWTHRYWQPTNLRWRLPWHLFQTASLAFGITGIVTRKQEKDADVASARKLHLEQEAVDLVRKKIQQNISLRDHGDMGVTARGNSRFEWTHPSLTAQLEYLSRLH
eukprot:TRINITY_DN13196_c0_g1_i1.p1 TRINITY_DN13196_c0_g1~~TRINITY_DN13196_c0_g1_i1.p1  ORF type:complete len:336 (+),score=68.00 TRINITY_DN13196_c0_g1_i1:83-1090(+)